MDGEASGVEPKPAWVDILGGMVVLTAGVGVLALVVRITLGILGVA